MKNDGYLRNCWGWCVAAFFRCGRTGTGAWGLDKNDTEAFSPTSGRAGLVWPRRYAERATVLAQDSGRSAEMATLLAMCLGESDGE